jgi:hypothetical protein
MRRPLEHRRQLIPKEVSVYLQLDAWHIFACLLKFTQRHDWDVTCSMCSTRVLGGQRLDQRFMVQQHRPNVYVELERCGRFHPDLFPAAYERSPEQG